MAENENLTSVSQQENVNDSVDYIEALKEMKQNSVTRESYDKLKSENKKLLDALVNGTEINVPKEEPVDVNELRKKLFDRDSTCSNLEYIETTLKLRNALIEQGERDPFLPVGTKVDLTEEQYEKAEKVAEILQECVDFADGDSGIFTAELQRRTNDVMPRYGKKK